jgi:hypothetical protein
MKIGQYELPELPVINGSGNENSTCLAKVLAVKEIKLVFGKLVMTCCPTVLLVDIGE